MNAIEVHNLSKNFKSYQKDPGLMGSFRNLFSRTDLTVEAVKDVTFSLQEGEFIGLIGPNGAGKTTLLKVLSGLLVPLGGTVQALGHVPWHRENAFKRQIAFVMGQKGQLWWDLPAMDSFLLNREIYEIDAQAFEIRVAELAGILDMQSHLRVQVRRLSLGQRMKAELIAAFLHAPRLLLLDEPTLGLDHISQRQIRDFIKDYTRRERVTAILTSHYVDDIVDLCNRVLILNQGQLVFDGSIQSILNQVVPRKRLTVSFSSPIANDQVVSLPYVVRRAPLSITLEPPREEVIDISRTILELPNVRDLAIAEPSINEVIDSLIDKR